MYLHVRLLCPHDISGAGGTAAVRECLLADKPLSPLKQKLHAKLIARFVRSLLYARKLLSAPPALPAPTTNQTPQAVSIGVSDSYAMYCGMTYRSCQARILQSVIDQSNKL